MEFITLQEDTEINTDTNMNADTEEMLQNMCEMEDSYFESSMENENVKSAFFLPLPEPNANSDSDDMKEEEEVLLSPIKTKPTILNGVPVVSSKIYVNNIDNLDKFLENERTCNENDSWSNLDKTAKIRKLNVFALEYAKQHELNEAQSELLGKFLKDALDHKKIQRVKDVVYDKTTGLIKSIPALAFNKPTNHFTLRNVDKRVSTLKSLPPKKNVRSTAKQPPTIAIDSK
jgi:hypothetical protein